MVLFLHLTYFDHKVNRSLDTWLSECNSLLTSEYVTKRQPQSNKYVTQREPHEWLYPGKGHGSTEMVTITMPVLNICLNPTLTCGQRGDSATLEPMKQEWQKTQLAGDTF